MNYTLSNGVLDVTISDMGAELISIVKDGKERLWQNPTGEWSGHAPLLFPVCGKFSVQVDGVKYDLPSHGFTRRSLFMLKEQGKDFISFTLTHSEKTLAVFPYEFIFTVIYKLSGARITITYEVENPADKPLYFACGSHETFAYDKDICDYELVFDEETSLVHYFHDADGALTGETKDFGALKNFPLPKKYLSNSDTLIFKDITAKEVTLKEIGGKEMARIGYHGFAHLLLWHAGEGKYVCIEPWTNLPDWLGEPAQEFSQKAGVIKVEPKQKTTMERFIEYV